jgi:hypothetical protein
MSLNRGKIRLLDYEHSSVGWLTKQGSGGLFRIDSKIKIKKKIYYLARTVMAGNVYGNAILPIFPNYYYQWMTDGLSRIIFRTSANGNIFLDKGDKDIKKYLLNIKLKNRREIDIEDIINSKILSFKVIICYLEFENQICEFPINHLNIHLKNKKFQVETGPIVLKNKNTFCPAFIFFNCKFSCQVVWGYPRLEGIAEVLKTKIRFFI